MGGTLGTTDHDSTRSQDQTDQPPCQCNYSSMYITLQFRYTSHVSFQAKHMKRIKLLQLTMTTLGHNVKPRMTRKRKRMKLLQLTLTTLGHNVKPRMTRKRSKPRHRLFPLKGQVALSSYIGYALVLQLITAPFVR